jgi:hypothetical protein
MLKSLANGWRDDSQKANVAAGNWRDLPPFDELDHPAVEIAQGVDSDVQRKGQFDKHDEASKNAKYRVIEARDLAKGPGWRTAIAKYGDSYWAVYANTHDAFHRKVAAMFKPKNRAMTEPSVDDFELRALKLEQAKAVFELRQWRESIVQVVTQTFREAWTSPTLQASADLPDLDTGEGELLRSRIEIEVLRGEEEESLAEILVGIQSPGNPQMPKAAMLMTTVLAVIKPSADSWVKSAVYTKDNSGIILPVSLSSSEAAQILFASEVAGAGYSGVEVPNMEPTASAHFVSRVEIVDSIVTGRPMRSACGRWIVSQQDPETKPVCGDCEEQLPDFSITRDLLTQIAERNARNS